MKHNTKYILGVAILSLAAMLMILGVVLWHSYEGRKALFIADMNRALEESVSDLNHRSFKGNSPKENAVFSSYDSIMHIIRDDIPHQIRLTRGTDLYKALKCAIYDIRNTSQWTLPGLDALFIQKIQGMQIPHVFILKNAKGETLESLSANMSSLSGKKQPFVIPLGLLDQHTLTAGFRLPVNLFLQQEWTIVTAILTLLLALGICISVFVATIHNEQLLLANQKLFVQTLNHDLKSMVQLIGTNLSLLKAGNPSLTASEKKYHDTASRKTQETLRFIDQLILDSVNKKGLTLHCETFNLRKLIEKTITEITSQPIPDKKVTFETVWQPGENETVTGDYTHLARAFRNLAENSIKYSGQEVTIRIACIRSRRKIILTIEDNGFGISKANHRRIFTPGFRVPETGQDIRGYGLGLSYVRMVLKAHHGKIRLMEKTGPGCKFKIELKA